MAPDQIAVPAYADRSLTITVRRVEALLESVSGRGRRRFTLRGTQGRTLEDAALPCGAPMHCAAGSSH